MTPLPIDAFLGSISSELARRRAIVVTAAPGAGKTTRLAPFLARTRRVILLQPRRIAARALARRIALEQSWVLGRDVGWHVRFDRRFTPETRLLVATEGVLTARLRTDPLLSDFETVVLDEFHERSLHADLALALVRQAARARSELEIVVMSATIDTGPVAEFLGGCPVVAVPGRAHPVETAYAPGLAVPEAVVERGRTAEGHLLCFLPGVAEIRRVQRAIDGRVGEAGICILHGRLDADAQDEVLRPSRSKKIILATNVAETSLTVDGVTDVVDSGLHKLIRYDADRAIDRLVLERIPQDSADQRAGRAGRTGPGRVLRLWDERDRLRPCRQPEIARVDLAAPLLEVLAWGGDPRTFEWLEAPPESRVLAALEDLERLGATSGGRLTTLGEKLLRLPLHPRLGCLLLAAGGTRRAAAACAQLAEGAGLSGPAQATSSDLLVLADDIDRSAPHVRQAAEELRALGQEWGADPVDADPERALRRAALLAYPDRVARRRAAGSPKLLLASGQGAVLARESGVVDAVYLVALDVAAAAAGGEALVRLASRVEPEWLVPTHRDVDHSLVEEKVRAVEREWYGKLLLSERAVTPDAEQARLLRRGALSLRGLGPGGEQLVRRLRFAGLAAHVEGLIDAVAAAEGGVGDRDLASFLPGDVRRQVERLAPEGVDLPSGRRGRLEYREDGAVALSVKLQELFGWAETPRIGPRREPILILLLAPSGRPVQTTRDLKSFWERTYPEVRRELRGRYPRHPWPEDPWTAMPTARAKPREGASPRRDRKRS